jgi:hypothetical protein
MMNSREVKGSDRGLFENAIMASKKTKENHKNMSVWLGRLRAKT